jgi:hypothetical protein
VTPTGRWCIYWRGSEVEALQAKVLTADEARRVAINVAKLPGLLRQGVTMISIGKITYAAAALLVLSVLSARSQDRPGALKVPQVGDALKNPEKGKLIKCIQIMANQIPQPPGRPPTFAECQQILEQASLTVSFRPWRNGTVKVLYSSSADRALR